MTISTDTFTPKSKPPAAHYCVSTVHDIASDIVLSNPENFSNVFVQGNTYLNTTETHKIFHQTFQVSTTEKNKNTQIVTHTYKDGNNKLNNNHKTPIKNLCKVMFIHTMEVWKKIVRNIPAVQIFRTLVRIMSIQETQLQFLIQRAEMLPAQYISIKTNLS
jgi:hypothetical protein